MSFFNKVSFYSSLSLMMLVCSNAFGFGANEVYWWANQKNYANLEKLRTFRAIDILDNQGNTAYCRAVVTGDKGTQQTLLQYGANPNHPCVRRVQRDSNKRYFEKRYGSTNDSTFSNKYLWWGLGAAAVGGGVAALAGSGGSGGSHNYYISGPTAQQISTKPTIDSQVFITQEYNDGNFLEAIKASTGYSYMYREDELGNLSSHTAENSPDEYKNQELKKVLVGLIDSGVYDNKDLEGKIYKKISIGEPEKSVQNRIFVYYDSADKKYHFVLKYNEIYWYCTGAYDRSRRTWVLGKTNNANLNLEDLEQALGKSGLSFSDFTVIDGSENGPGVAESTIFTEAWVSSLGLVGSEIAFDIAMEAMHGTHIAGIIAGNKNDEGVHGVAFDNAQIYAASWDLSSDIYPSVKQMVDEGVEVFSNSWGPDASEYPASDIGKYRQDDLFSAYAYVASHGGVWVHAVGNESDRKEGVVYDATIDTGLGLVDLSEFGYSGPKKYEAPIISVGALERADNGQWVIANYSNNCGSTAKYCLVAPGTDINSTAALQEGSIYMSGTSMATPVVAGSVALLMGYYPWLSAQNIAYLLLETANNKGIYADKKIYGRGLIDLKAAVSTPIGGLNLASNSSFDSLQPVALSKLQLSTVIQNRLLNNLPKSVVAFDELHRPFSYSTANLVSTTHGSNANLRRNVAGLAGGLKKKTVKDEKNGYSFTSEKVANSGGQNKMGLAEFTHENEEGLTRFYWAEHSGLAQDSNVFVKDGNPYFQMNDAYGAENVMKLSDDSKFRIMLQAGKNGLNGHDKEQDKVSFDEKSYAIAGEYEFGLTDYLTMAVMGGNLIENDALLGINGRGGFNIKDSSTFYTGIKAHLQLTPKLSILAAYWRGYTRGARATMLTISDIQTESFMLASEYKFNKNHKVGLSVASPLSVARGSAVFSYASGRDRYSDTIYMKKLKTNLKPEAKEYDLGAYYMGETEKELGIGGKIEARFNADGEKGLMDYIGMIGLEKAF